jgi:2-polyprenyl-3-methyl-5-hydroxy-6-metoxy-1,4-benzoquinol methylase
MMALGGMVDHESFLQRFSWEELTSRVVTQVDIPAPEVRRRLGVCASMVPIGLQVAGRGIRPGSRVLEVGAGLGLVSLALRASGYDVTALEPVGQGFDFVRVALEEVHRAVPEIAAPLLPIRVEELDPRQHGAFDCIFSVHVLEHVEDLERAMAGMASVLRPGGTMVHLCPNYAFPYDPHFKIPLIPFAPGLTSRLLPRRIRETELWRSLNFISYDEVRRLATRHGLAARFEKGLLHQSFTRLETDRVFAERHSRRSIHLAHRLLKRTGLLRLLQHLPPGTASPMLFSLVHRTD